MKSTTFLLSALLTLAWSAVPVRGAILLASLGSGTEAVSTDTTTISIDGSGNASAPGGTFADYAATGSVTPTLAFSTSFDITIDAVASVNTTVGVNYGSKTTDGLIDRDSSGRLGVREGAGNGIELGEGYLVGLDASGLDSSLAWQVTGIRFEFVGGGEQWTVVNRSDTSKSLSGTNSALVDVTSLGLLVQGGTSQSELFSAFMSDVGTGSNFRITQFELEVVPEPSSSALTALALGGLALRRRRR